MIFPLTQQVLAALGNLKFGIISRGDVNVVLQVNVDYPIQRFNAGATVNRSVVLDRLNAINGSPFWLVWEVGTAFTWTVLDKSAVTLYTTTAATKNWAIFMNDGNNWRLIAQGELP